MSGVAESLRESRTEVLAAADARGLSNVRVFGSVARGEATSKSDVDLLVHPHAGSSIFDLAGFMSEVEELLGAKVDVVSDRGTGRAMERILAEAVPL
ncbi:nucleotidyltransferase family protein [Rathayibacter sp. CAU 1779]